MSTIPFKVPKHCIALTYRIFKNVEFLFQREKNLCGKGRKCGYLIVTKQQNLSLFQIKSFCTRENRSCLNDYFSPNNKKEKMSVTRIFSYCHRLFSKAFFLRVVDSWDFVVKRKKFSPFSYMFLEVFYLLRVKSKNG